MNLHGHTICGIHYEYLTRKFRRDYCSLYKVIFGARTNLKHDLRRVSRPIGFGVWRDYGLPIFDQAMCDRCRKNLEKKYFKQETIENSENIFSWLYDDYTIYTPSVIPSATYSMYQFSEDQDLQFDQKNNLKQFLVNNGFQGRVPMTSSYCSMLQNSQLNFQRQAKAIFCLF